MKPENISPNINPETMPSLPRPNVEFLNKKIETGVEKSTEQVEQISELRSIISDVAATTKPQVTDEKAIEDVENTTTINDNPLSAKDEDLIEKEWVDRAKKIVEQTSGDPYTREEEVNKLQADYLKKRYDRDVSISE